MTGPHADEALWGDVRDAVREARRLGLGTGPTERLLHGEGPAALWRGCPAGHVTAACAVLSADLDRVLLVMHRRLGLWLQPGGHLEPGDGALRAAAAREVAEETGLRLPVRHLVDVDVHAVPCAGRAAVEHHDLRFAAVAPPDLEGSIAISGESTDLQWFALDALPELRGSTRRLVTRARRHLAAVASGAPVAGPAPGRGGGSVAG